MASYANTLVSKAPHVDFLEIEDPQTICNFSVHGVRNSKFDIYNEEIASLSSCFEDSVQDCMTKNLKSKRLCDPTKNYTMPFYSYFSERNHILKDLISQVLQCSLQEQGQTCRNTQNKETQEEKSIRFRPKLV